METPPSLPLSATPPERARTRSVTVKLLVLGLLILVLQVPLLLVRDTLGDRRRYRDQAVTEISAGWGGPQVIAGPFLTVPYTVRARFEQQTLVGDRMVKTEETREVRGTAWFLPSEFRGSGEMAPSERYRGIFRTPVYSAVVALSGRFDPDPGSLGLEGAVLDWSRAALALSVSDTRGLRAAPTLRFAGRELAFQPALARSEWTSLVVAPAGIDAESAAAGTFEIRMDLQGAPRLALAPVGSSNRVELAGAWRDPSFDGGLLPVWREVAPGGFSARWETAHFGRGYPQQWAEHAGRSGVAESVVARSAVGVTLVSPVDGYRLVERSLKYSLLFMVLLFAGFFGFEVTTGARAHPLQYLLSGAALGLFYLGFLSLGEFVAPWMAYAGAAGSSTALITAYSWSVLGTGRRALTMGAGQSAVFAYLYFILQLQDYALLAGTAGLFLLLGAVMWLTRRVDWYALDRRSPAQT